jgi:hypothetical protein
MQRINSILMGVVLLGLPPGAGGQDVEEQALTPKECPPDTRMVQSDHPDQGYTQVCMDFKGRQHGWALMWYPDGQAKDYSEAVHGKLHGKAIGWFENGKLQYSSVFKTGERHGPDTRWFDNGRKRSEGRYADGFREGLWKYWFPNGQLRKRGLHKKGIPAGKWEYWTEKGARSEHEVFIKWPKKTKPAEAKKEPVPAIEPSRLDAGVLVGASLVAKRQVLEDKRLGRIKQIARSQVAGGTWLVGEQGALLLDRRLDPVRWVKFPGRASQALVLDADGDGEEEFLVRSRVFGHHRIHLPLFLLDSKGAVRWDSRLFWSRHPVTAGDLDGDGRVEFAGPGGWGKDDGSGFEWGVVVLNADGQTTRKLPAGGTCRVFILDRDGDGHREIASLDWKRHMRVHDSKGAATKGRKYAKGSKSGTLCPWPNHDGRPHLLWIHETSAWLADFSSSDPIRFDAPLANTGSTAGAVGVPVRLRFTHRPYLAVAVKLRQQQSLLYIMTPKGRVEYLEVIPEPVDALGTTEVSGRGEEELLVGGKGRLWSYRFNQVKYDNLAEAVFRVFAFGTEDIKLADVEPRNMARQLREGWYEWTVYIDGPADSLERIACVQYSLHPSFPDPHHLVCEPGEGPRRFALKREGWGTFSVGIRIFLKSGPVQEMSHQLRF